MSVKIYDKKQKKWIIFPGTIGAPGKDAYLIAQENGYTGTKEEYAKVLTDIPKVINSIEEEPTEGSKNLITSGGVWQAIDNVHTTINNQIKSSIVDNLESLAADKSLSANQGRILKEMIANLANLQIEIVDQLPSVGETNIIYLVKKSGSAPDIHDEYVFVDGKWEKIGDTEIDLSNYYTRDEVDDKLTGFGAGDVIAAEAFTTADRVITSNGPGKTVKDSGILINNLALKSYVDEKEIAWDKVTGKPETYVPAAHTHPLAQITDAGALAYKDKVDESDLIIGSSLEFNAFGRFNYIATSTEAGGIKIGATASGVNLPLVLNSSNQAYIAVTKGAVTAALGFTPANVNDIPEIPITLPNPYALNVTAGGSTTSYTGSSASTIDLDNIYAKKLPSVDTPGKPGLYFASSGSVNVTEVYVTENNPDAIILVANTVDVTFGENYHKMDGIDSLSGGNYKCYCITYVRGVVLVNGAIYG